MVVVYIIIVLSAIVGFVLLAWIEAIAPIDVPETKKAAFPDGVMEAWNDRIALNYSGGRAFINQNDIVEDICAKMDVDRQTVFANKWLDVEDIYRNQGWDVVYDKPPYYDSSDPTFTFTAKG